MRSFQRFISFLSTPSTITGLHVAPTVPFCSIDDESSCREQESFQSAVGVVWVMR